MLLIADIIFNENRIPAGAGEAATLLKDLKTGTAYYFADGRELNELWLELLQDGHIAARLGAEAEDFTNQNIRFLLVGNKADTGNAIPASAGDADEQPADTNSVLISAKQNLEALLFISNASK